MGQCLPALRRGKRREAPFDLRLWATGQDRCPIHGASPELNRLPNRPDLSASEIEALELLLRRCGALAPSREEELAEMVAPIFAARMHLRYRDPVRFLALLHHKATARSEVVAQP